jgi:hypothetical protein
MTDLLDPTIYPAYGSDELESWDTLVLASDSGISQVRAIRTVPRWIVNYVWERPVDANLDTLQAFFRTQKGPQTTFYAYTVDPWRYWSSVAAGTGTGSELLFFYPGRQVGTGNELVKVDTTTQTAGVDYDMTFPSDANKRGQITFKAGHAPTNEKAVTISYRGTRLLLGRLVRDATTQVVTFGRLRISAQFSGEEV